MDRACNDITSLVMVDVAKKILTIIQIAAPILAIIGLTIIFIKMMQNPDDKKLQKNIKNVVIALIVVFLIPTITKAVINLVALQTVAEDCLEEEELQSIRENLFSGSTYIEIDEDAEKNKKPVVPDPEGYEYGVPKDPGDSSVITAPSTGNAVYFLNVGASSDAILIQDDNKYGLIDTGYYTKASFVVKQLKILGVSELDFVLITHAHGDHTGGYNKVMENFKVKQFFTKTDGASHNGTYRSMINKAKKNGAYVCDVSNPQCQSFNLGNIHFNLYNTQFLTMSGLSSANHTRFENANSIVAVATYNGKRVYFAGDIGNYFGRKQESLTARQVGDIDVYKVAHHGYVSFNNNQDAVNQLKADYAVITNTRGPSNVALSRIRSGAGKNTPAYYTAEGTVVMTIDTNGKINFS